MSSVDEPAAFKAAMAATRELKSETSLCSNTGDNSVRFTG
jgi:hypothetical protein